MTCKRLLLAAVAAAAVVSAGRRGALAEDVDPTLTQDQANRLSLFHDYGLNAVGSDNDVALPVNVGSPNDVGGPEAGAPSGGGLLGGLMMPGYGSTGPTGRSTDPFSFSAAPVVGYDSNPQARRVSRASIFAGGDLGVAYHVTDGANDPIVGQPLRATFAYDVLGAAYEGQAEAADTLQQNLASSVRQTLFDNSIVVSAALSDSFTMLHGEAFLDTFDAGATGEFFFLPQASIETGFNYTHFQYFFRAILPAQKPTADRDTFVAKIHLYPLPQRRGAEVPEAPDVLTEILRATLRRATVNYNHIWNLPTEDNGNDYKYEDNRVGFGLEGLTLPGHVGNRSLGPFAQSVSFDADYNHEFQTYEFANTANRTRVLAGHLTPRGGQHRKDGIDVFTLRGDARLLDLPKDAGTLATYLQWDLIHDGSNIVPRRYNEYLISGGVTYRY